MKYARMIAATVAMFAFAVGGVSAQGVSLEARGGLTFPTGDFGDIADGNAAFGGDVFFNVSPSVSIYGGYQYETFDDGGDDLSSNGFEAGLKLMAARESGVLPWVKVGGVLNKLEAGAAESDRALGLQAAIGMDIPLGEVLSFSPALRYQAWTAEFDGGFIVTEQSVRTFALDFGLHVHPGS